MTHWVQVLQQKLSITQKLKLEFKNMSTFHFINELLYVDARNRIRKQGRERSKAQFAQYYYVMTSIFRLSQAASSQHEGLYSTHLWCLSAWLFLLLRPCMPNKWKQSQAATTKNKSHKLISSIFVEVLSHLFKKSYICVKLCGLEVLVDFMKYHWRSGQRNIAHF